jgi:hypothetical protein
MGSYKLPCTPKAGCPAHPVAKSAVSSGLELEKKNGRANPGNRDRIVASMWFLHSLFPESDAKTISLSALIRAEESRDRKDCDECDPHHLESGRQNLGSRKIVEYRGPIKGIKS